MTNLSSKENTYYKNFALNEPFEDKGLDGTMHEVSSFFFLFLDYFFFKIKFGLINDDILTESHIRFENGNKKEETYQYSIENDKLVLVNL